MATQNGSKRSLLRTLWLPGSRKNHPKGRYETTNKQISYTGKQKKNEVWSLGGSKTQKDFLSAEAKTLSDGPSVSSTGRTAVAGTIAVASLSTSTPNNAPPSTSTSSSPSPSPSSIQSDSLIAADTNLTCINQQQEQQQESSGTTSATLSISSVKFDEPQTTSTPDNLSDRIAAPTSPNSTASTALLASPVDLLEELFKTTTVPAAAAATTTITAAAEQLSKMPARSHSPVPVIVTATTNAEIIDESRYTMLNNGFISSSEEFDLLNLPSPPKDFANSNYDLHQLRNFETNAIAVIKTPDTARRKDNTTTSYNSSIQNTPVKKNLNHSNHNGKQVDVNSIESITDETASAKMDEVLSEKSLDSKTLTKTKKKRKKKSLYGKELDQLDGVPIKTNAKDRIIEDEDDKVVKCLYYTLMCCECTIS